MTTVRIESNSWASIAAAASNSSSNTSAPIYYAFDLVGDEDSVRSVLDVLASSSCDVMNNTVYPYDSTNSSQPQPQQVVQYYRSSTFALTLELYNNNATTPANQPSSNTSSEPDLPDTPLPSNHTDMNFLSCINQTIGEALPIEGAATRNIALGTLWLWVMVFHLLRSMF